MTAFNDNLSRRWHLPLSGLKHLLQIYVSRHETDLAVHVACELHLSGQHRDIWQWLEVLACENFGRLCPRLPEAIHSVHARAELFGLFSEPSRAGLVCAVVTMCTLTGESRHVASLAHTAQDLFQRGHFSPLEQQYEQVPERVRVALDALCPDGPLCQLLHKFVRALYLPNHPTSQRHALETLGFYTETILLAVEQQQQQQQQLIWDALQLVCVETQVKHIRLLQDIYNSGYPKKLRRPFLYHALLCVAFDSAFDDIEFQILNEVNLVCMSKEAEWIKRKLFSSDQQCPEGLRSAIPTILHKKKFGTGKARTIVISRSITPGNVQERNDNDNDNGSDAAEVAFRLNVHDAGFEYGPISELQLYNAKESKKEADNDFEEDSDEEN